MTQLPCGCWLNGGAYASLTCREGHSPTNPPPEALAARSKAQQAHTPRPFRSVSEPEGEGRQDAPRFGRHRLNVDTGQVEKVED